MIQCEDRKDIDSCWDRLTAGGDPAARQRGWLKDKFGVSWQVAPARIDEWVGDPDSPSSQRTMAVMMEMKKLEIAKLEAAYTGR